MSYNHEDIAATIIMKTAEFDIDDEEDQRLYNRIKDDPRTDQWQREVHDSLKDSRNFWRNMAIGSGAVGAGSGIAAYKLPAFRKALIPLAVTSGVVSGLSGLGSYGDHSDMKAYDRDRPGVRRRTNIDYHMDTYGSGYGGRHGQHDRASDRTHDMINTALQTAMIASALSDRN